MEQSASWTQNTRYDFVLLQASSQGPPVSAVVCPSGALWLFSEFGADYKYSDLLTLFRLIQLLLLNIQLSCLSLISGTGIRGLMRGMATLPHGKQELLVVRDKVGRPPGELGISKSMEYIFPSVLWDCWLGDRKGIRPVKKLDVGLLVVMIWLQLCTTYISRSPFVATTSIILCFNKHWLTQVHLENGR